MKLKLLLLLIAFSSLKYCVWAQDTFSIVALDSITGEVGSAGASCIDLYQTSLATDDFIGQLIPGVGAINTQAWYIPANQENATMRMKLGEAPDEVIQWLIAHDVSSEPELRQYGIVGLVDGTPRSAAYTGDSTDDYKNHITGPNYAIQGNILLGQEVLSKMEDGFLNENGDLACKLMAALQGANILAADKRCASNKTSSLFAYVKVAHPTDLIGNPSFLVSARTHEGDEIEPIDKVQSKFDNARSCATTGSIEINIFKNIFNIYPNPSVDKFIIENIKNSDSINELKIRNIEGKLVLSKLFKRKKSIDISQLIQGTYFIYVTSEGTTYSTKIVKK